MAGPNFGYSDPSSPPPETGGGSWVWDAAKGLWNFLSDNSGALINAAGNAAGAYETAAQTAAKIAEQKAEFGVTSAQQAARDAAQQAQAAAALKEQEAALAQQGSQFGRTTGDTEGQTAVGVQGQINRSPIADKAQALLMARMGVQPGAFQPRDYTQGISNIARPFTTPGAPVATAMQSAAAHYTPGQGGVDTSTAQQLLAKLKASSGISDTAPPGGFPPPTHPISNGPTPPDLTGAPPRITPKLTLPATPPVLGTPSLSSGVPPETDPNDPTNLLLKKMQLQPST